LRRCENKGLTNTKNKPGIKKHGGGCHARVKNENTEKANLKIKEKNKKYHFGKNAKLFLWENKKWLEIKIQNSKTKLKNAKLFFEI
jgi:hypothetical protein